jgi:two-component system, NarL family, response regulator LiaR
MSYNSYPNPGASPSAPPVRLLLVDDHHMVRAGLRALLDHEIDINVVGEAADGRLALEMVRELSPDVVVMDLCMPNLNGIDATRQVLAAMPTTKVIGLSAMRGERMITELLRAGAVGFVDKESAFEDLVNAVRAVVRGHVCFSPDVINRVGDAPGDVTAPNDRQKVDSVFRVLTPREREVLQMIAEGKAIKEVAAALHISSKTAETHRRNLMDKLQVDSVAQLTKYAIREGLTTA